MELPEITVLSGQMNRELAGGRIAEVDVSNEKCLNVPLAGFRDAVVGRKVSGVRPRGKWVFLDLERGTHILLNTGMGADIIRYAPDGALPERYHQRVGFDDGSGFTIRVWWFSYLHAVPAEKLGEHRLTRDLGPSPLDEAFTVDYFRGILGGRRGGVKAFLTDQRNVAGIGNVYIHDPLFMAGVHPLRNISTLSRGEVDALYGSIRAVLRESIGLGGLSYERDFYGVKGGYGKDHYRVAYKEGEPCPVCGAAILKIRTGSTASFVCPTCQPL